LVKPEEKRKYDALFDQLQPVEDKLPGDKVWQKNRDFHRHSPNQNIDFPYKNQSVFILQTRP
jgi:hypothetical protein